MSEAKGVGGIDPRATPGSAGAGERPPMGTLSPRAGEGELYAPMPSKHMVINLGPSHPAMHGVTRAVVELNGEIIEGMKLDIGFLHRGFEKSCENVTWGQVFPYTDRLNYVSSIMNNVGFALAVEKLAKLEIPERARYLRVITSEIHRICDHLTLVGAMAMELGAMTVFLYGIEARDLLWDRLAELCGARLTSNYARIGGVARDIPEGWQEKTLKVLDRVVAIREEIGQLLNRNRIFIDRCLNTGKVSREDALELGFTGPCLRASGEPYDVRKAAPYLVYDRLDFDIPVGSNGDNFDRYLMRMEEMRQSDKIIRQCFEQMAPGEIIVQDFRYALPPKPLVYGTIEGVMAHFKLVMEGIKVPAGEVYSYTEAANGELGFYVVSDGGGRPYKLGLRAPGWPMLAALPVMTKGSLLSDLIPTFDSINMIGGEVEQ
ncbi:NADH dehydrogenase (quinone) [Anaeromyxobacter sp. K]|uniref:NADH-quinone oxidoreductase subunit D 2 n=1 Tax=Anaeromyxobacter sp. (strain K) TaxID=447217 RepID=NUOD2_ANASK|nr:NADH-quinone oxidoreductase subunit D [Anaeromyxobacter sp. K]B4UIA9.1 RecName: Full=NADH-quinone oxidoreductase subunit D 2; AltName: Full=NADH dehydrogenase I subunit D 2; AltName: Full=NDH-1 subunit D 2 [Anaeromyxobacter sp. K]ACG72514.1 NADH dehydrogenase (quinone) [Anaeromyxobacter sp. K]